METEYTIASVDTAKELGLTNYEQSYTELVAIEKFARNSEKMELLNKTVTALMENAWEHSTVETLVNVFHFILTRRAQQKSAIIVVVKKCAEYIQQLKAKGDFVHYEMMSKSVCTETEGKVFVDIERARIVKDYALFLEHNKNLAEATQLMQSMHIETFTSLDKKERMDFLLVQLRISLECDDYLRAMLLSNKVNRTTIQSEGFEELRLEFCRLMVKYYSHEMNYIENCRMMLMCFETLTALKPEVKFEISENEFLRTQKFCIDESVALKLAVMYLICAEFIPEKKDLLTKLKGIRMLENFPVYQGAVEMFLTEEVIDSKRLVGVYVELYKSECAIHMERPVEEIAARLQLQITQHNVRIIAKYYHNITLSRFAELLGVTINELEKQICALVNSKQIFAKIDRPKALVSFVKTKDPKEVLDIWSEDIQQLLTLVNDTCFLIETEKMVHQGNN
ncbi:26S proteasome non-ATPase regulatory subunit, putative [Entamoeba invadens IP1]|uniref:26S proteasome non-ATPase regulatory subunit, putative n=1 Tax=Entamoeba invadens IP1 TaxID=370355 RepID=A0A0A1U7X5_ENTIV|nr:26S proteasome non-ATPase regulatory subunit, putative [Entamoeba invadens IP1]ELP91034.1 26S proteasome non-ATPase regulatory subunit, putative [Entamoeba invadens IP1]|eukprot:XP_004257805.1 26S proteasome non-ATPase regulatory subunit, putative [Entamoeba invadens IP1]